MSIFQKAYTTVGVKKITINDVVVGFQPCYTGGQRYSWRRHNREHYSQCGNAIRADLMFRDVADAWEWVDNMEARRAVCQIHSELVTRNG